MKTVLIVDDSELVRSVVSVVLGASGYRVVSIEDARTIEEVVRREAPDLVLLDVMPASASCASAVARARKGGSPSLRVVLYSDRPDAELAGLTARSGATAYIRKAGAPSLVHHVERLLAG